MAEAATRNRGRRERKEPRPAGPGEERGAAREEERRPRSCQESAAAVQGEKLPGTKLPLYPPSGSLGLQEYS